MNLVLRRIISQYNPILLEKLDSALSLNVKNFKRDLFPSMENIDILIPGAGFQYVIWVGDDAKYPFPGWKFDAISRPMKYIPDTLASGMKFAHMARFIAQSSGGHVEECVKFICDTLNLPVRGYEWTPIGRLVRNPSVIDTLGTNLASNILDYTNLMINRAKHDYHGGTPEPVISFSDAIGGYYVSRILSSQILQKAGLLEPYTEAIKDAYAKGIVYTMPDSGGIPEDEDAWPLKTDLEDLE